LTPAQTRLHQRVLRSFIGEAGATNEQLVAWAEEERVDPDQAYRVLAARDLVHRDPGSGNVAVAYPFSGMPTPHRVRLGTGSEVYAMCALDALGVAFMLDAPTDVVSRDPKTAESIEVSVRPHGRSDWRPADAAVVVGCGGTGTSAACMCPHTNFVASTDHGHALMEEMQGSVSLLSMSDAIEAGRELFGDLLDDEGERSHGQARRA
jgi:Alkylmercury lyase